MTKENVVPDFSKEDLSGTLVEFATGAWVCGERHHPGAVSNLNLNNRTFVFKLKLKESLSSVPAGEDCLLVYGVGNAGAIKGVKKLEFDTGLKAVALLNNGGSHHILLGKWYAAFPELDIWVTPTRIPRTYNGEQLMKKYADRWELVDNTTTKHHVYQLLKYFGNDDDMQVDCVVFNQVMAATDKTSTEMGSWKDPEEKPELKPTSFLPKLAAAAAECCEPSDDVVFFHRATNLIITGHHYQFIYIPKDYTIPKELKTEGSWVWRNVVPLGLYKRGAYESALGQNFQRVRDFQVHAAQWKEVMKWDYKYACSHHDVVGICGPVFNAKVMNGEGGLKGHMKRELEHSGELNGEPVKGFLFFGSTNTVCKCQQKEGKYVKKYGGVPTLPLGGPEYDGSGYLKAGGE